MRLQMWVMMISYTHISILCNLFNIQDESLQIPTVGLMLTLSIRLLGLINRVDLDVLNRVCVTKRYLVLS